MRLMPDVDFSSRQSHPLSLSLSLVLLWKSTYLPGRISATRNSERYRYVSCKNYLSIDLIIHELSAGSIASHTGLDGESLWRRINNTHDARKLCLGFKKFYGIFRENRGRLDNRN